MVKLHPVIGLLWRSVSSRIEFILRRLGNYGSGRMNGYGMMRVVGNRIIVLRRDETSEQTRKEGLVSFVLLNIAT